MRKGDLQVAYDRALSELDRIHTHLYQVDRLMGREDDPTLDERAGTIVARLRAAEARLAVLTSDSPAQEALARVAEHLTRLPVGVVECGLPEARVSDLVYAHMLLRDTHSRIGISYNRLQHEFAELERENRRLAKRLARLEGKS